MSTSHHHYLERCIQLARLGGSYVLPNPLVGALIVHQGRIIGEGFHTAIGKAHAEIEAFNSISPKDRNLLSQSTLYVSLEPCNHHGRTPPCTEAILKNKIPKVIVGCEDPNPLVGGNGLMRLKQNGLHVELASDPTPFQELNKVFFTNQLLKRTYIILKWAESSDKKMSQWNNDTNDYKRTSITSNLSNIEVHKLRSQVQGILVGKRTAQIDNPSLTTRNFYGNSPSRLILGNNQSLSPDLKIFNDDKATQFIISAKNIDYSIKQPSQNTQYLTVANTQDLSLLAKSLYREHKIASLLVEGGANVLSQFLDQEVYDEIHIFKANKKLGNGLNAPNIPNQKDFFIKRELGVDNWLSLITHRWKEML